MTESYSFVRAIHDKYDDDDVSIGKNVIVTGSAKIFVPKSGPASRNKGKLQLPRRLTLDNNNISVAGDESEIADLCASVEELDLTKNKITDWIQVFEIISSMSQLHFLNLTLNPLDNSTFPDALHGTFPRMLDLVLNNTAVSWGIVAKLLPVFPNLRAIHLSLNDFTSVDIPSDFKQDPLTSVFLNDCPICEFGDVQKLGEAFQLLESLTLINTNISHLPDDADYQVFSCLKSLNVGGTKIATCEDVDRFARFPALTHLRMTGIPFMKACDEKERRRMIIARLPNINHLNGSAITDIEREESERFFIRHFLDKEVKPARFEELVAKHGSLDPLVHVDLTPENYVNLLVTYKEKSEYMDVYLHQTIYDYKKTMQKMTGLAPSEMRLFYVERLDGEFLRAEELKLRNKTKTLLSLNLNPGDEFQIERQTIERQTSRR